MKTQPHSEAISRPQKVAREIIDQIADRWSLLVIATLGKHQKLRFTQLRDEVEGVSQKMLTHTLRQLERDGIVTRHVHPVVPPHVDYQLTPLGLSLLEWVGAICSWVSTHLNEIEGSRERFDARTDKRPD
jgi:DNA-binding HxlR family transcriptional regulator